MEQPKKTLIKSNHLIESYSRLTLTEQRLLHLLLAKISADDAELNTYTLKTSEFKRYCGKHGATHELFKRAAKGLLGRRIIMRGRGGDLLMFTWLAYVKCCTGDGYIEMGFHQKLKPYLLQLKGEFTKLRTETLLTLRSTHSVRLYEILSRYQGLGSIDVGLEELRAMLGLDGGQYPVWSHLDARVLKPARAELAAAGAVVFEYTPIKTGRRITALRFKIQRPAKPKSKRKAKSKPLPVLEAEQAKCFAYRGRMDFCGTQWEAGNTSLLNSLEAKCTACPRYIERA